MNIDDPDLPDGQPEDSSPTIDAESINATLDGGAGIDSLKQIGPYHLLRVLGEGGMGEVWLAEQSKPIQRKVALKLIKVGMSTKTVIARFESERQALALMDHPSIARVFDAGSTPEGRPYFVMEYVPGTPITSYCDKHRLSVKERLELFIEVCDGVQHAHQKAIIHRDLKPSNVLVMEQGGKPVPKIIDFGLAKATAQRLTDLTMYTAHGVMLGTPEYMSPEQADLQEQNIDTRTDVYSLGVILYQLLVGTLPLETKDLQSEGVEGMLRVIREKEPPKPSTKIRNMGTDSNDSAEKRREPSRTFASRLRGELDWITMKALEKERARRYQSAADLGADIRRHLLDEPVQAGPPSASYRASKFVKRHRFGVLAAAAAVVLLIGFAGAMGVQARRIAKERDRANQQAEVSERVSRFMTDMFKVSDPSEARGNTVTAREILDKASKNIDSGLAQEPEVQAYMMHDMANVYYSLGLYKEAEPLAIKAVDIRKRLFGTDSRATLVSQSLLGLIYTDEGRFPEAEKLRREVLETSKRALGPDDPETIRAIKNLALILNEQGHYSDSEKLNREALAASQSKSNTDPNLTSSIKTALAMDLAYEGKYQDAENFFREALETDLKTHGPESSESLGAMNNVGAILIQQEKYAEAEKVYKEELEISTRTRGTEHPMTLMSMGNLAMAIDNQKRYEEAGKLYQQVLEIKRKVLGPNHRSTIVTLGNLAKVTAEEHKNQEAEELFKQAIADSRRVLGPDHYDTLTNEFEYAVFQVEEKKYAEAEKELKENIAGRVRVLGAEHPQTTTAQYYLAKVLVFEHKNKEALEVLRAALDHKLEAASALGLEKDPDFNALHDTPGFVEVVARAKEVAGAQSVSASK